MTYGLRLISKSDKLRIVLGLTIVVLYCAIELSTYFISSSIREFSDTAEYVAVASAPLYSKCFWGSFRSPFVPLIYKLFAMRKDLICFFQWIISILAWCCLGIALAVHQRTLIGMVFGLAAPLLWSLTGSILLWQNVLLSESIGVATLLFLISSWIMMFYMPNRLYLVLTVISATAFAFTRDSNAFMIILVACLIILVQLGRRVISHARFNGRYCTIALLYLVIAASAVISANSGKRWLFSYYNVVTQRILTNPERLAFFKASGMPLNDALLARSGKWASSDDSLLYCSQELKTFREWSDTKGKSTYLSFLLHNPAYALLAPFRDFRRLITAKYVGYLDFVSSPILLRKLCLLFSPSLLFYLLLFNSTLVFGIGIGIQRVRYCRIFIIAIVLGVLGLVHLIIAWHGDAMEVVRHCFIAVMQLKLALLLASIALMDHIFALAEF